MICLKPPFPAYPRFSYLLLTLTRSRQKRERGRQKVGWRRGGNETPTNLFRRHIALRSAFRLHGLVRKKGGAPDGGAGDHFWRLEYESTPPISLRKKRSRLASLPQARALPYTYYPAQFCYFRRFLVPCPCSTLLFPPVGRPISYGNLTERRLLVTNHQER